MNQKSSLQKTTQSVSQVLMPDRATSPDFPLIVVLLKGLTAPGVYRTT
jgi:hypothetical protein